ncbi:hypothetical protein C7B62_00725 [Pleurocapsa sp. CCALA 161]|uniref:hypothetical protein n=1 Tax=Pleurocapsa sp. CCALA 161 TaxID=2107688 RepID=UPI000D04F797|nr:hypothetical protein [Pleurocapsa sp. CCALA 161]PSB12644.1 hypothetical protein C7B62_00725 [Pleurocapsa sp. CCALA 161]
MINQLGIQPQINCVSAVGIIIGFNLGAIANAEATSDADYKFLINSNWRSCQQISTDYQEVYAFETSSFYVNICQKDDIYFYSGEAKQSDNSSIFMTATPLEHNRGFQAKNGNVSYVVILPFPENDRLEPSNLDPEEAILTIKRNDRLVAVESSLNKYCHQSEAIAFDNIKLNQGLNQLATISQQQDTSKDLLSRQPENFLPADEIFHSNSRFDFYRIDGELHRLVTCN